MKNTVVVIILILLSSLSLAVDIPVEFMNWDFEIPILVESNYNETVFFWNDPGTSAKHEADRSGEWMPTGFSQMLRLNSGGSVYQDLNINWSVADQYTIEFQACEVGWTAQAGETGEAVTVQLEQNDGTVLWSQTNLPLDGTLTGDLNAITLGAVSFQFSYTIDAGAFSTGAEGSLLRLRFTESGSAGAIWIDNVTLTRHITSLSSSPWSEHLIHHWKLDETTGSTVVDSVGGSNGTAAGTYDLSVAGISNTAIDNAGTAGTNGITTSPVFSGNMARAISLWFKADTYSTNQARLIGNGDWDIVPGGQFDLTWENSTGGRSVGLRYGNGNMYWSGSTEFGQALQTNTWYHLAVQYDGTTLVADSSLEVYINGVKLMRDGGNNNNSGQVLDTYVNSFWIGRNVETSQNNSFDGVIDDVQVYDNPLSSSEITYLYQNPGSPIPGQPSQNEILTCHWALDETTGTIASDSSGNVNTGTVNGTSFDVASSAGKIGTSLYFAGNTDGSDDWITNATAAGAWSEYSLSMWVKTSTLGQVEYVSVFNNSASSGSGFQIDVDGGNPGNYRYHGSVDVNLGAVTTDWIHLAAVCDGFDTRLFYNGNYVSTAPAADTFFARLELGVNRNRNQRFQGYIDDFQIYNVVLSDPEIQSLYSDPGSTIINAAGPVNVYGFTCDDSYLESASAVTLQWQVLGADTIAIDQGVGDVTSLTSNDGIGNTSVAVSETTTFTLTATNADRIETADITITVGPARPNVLFFVIDDMGTQDTSVPFYYVNGNPQMTSHNTLYRTPSMERMANSGMKFTSCYAMPVCSPTRNCLMTGLNSYRHGTTDWLRSDSSVTHTRNHRDLDPPKTWSGSGLLPSHITLPQLLSSAGYNTIFCGKGHFGSSGSYAQYPDNIGFDVNIGGYQTGSPPGSYYSYYTAPLLSEYSIIPQDSTGIFLTEALTCEVRKYIDETVGNGRPFFVYMSHYALHGAFKTDPRFGSNYPSLSGSNLSFATMIEGMDKSLGDLLDRLEDLGVAEDTLVMFIGDNGSDNPYGGNSNSSPLRGKKGNKYEGGVRVPLLVSWAKVNPSNSFQQALSIPSASVEEDIVACFDLYPTILDAAGVSFSHTIDGYTLTPYLKAQSGSHRPQQLVIHYPHDHNSDYFTIYREGDYKLIYDYDENSISDTFDAGNNDNVITSRFELYNLANDIGETTDLSDSDPLRVTAMANQMARRLNTALPLWPVLEGTSTTAPIDPDILCSGRADLNCDDIVDTGDLAEMAGVWLSGGFLGDFVPDEGDGSVDLKDLSGFALEWLN